MTLWQSRFRDSPSDVLWRYTVDHSDRRLLADDVTGSIAHVAMLAQVGLISAAESAELSAGLDTIRAEADTDSFRWADEDEDVHSAVERRLGELVGPVAGKLHTGRSRNDQIALDMRLYLRRSCRQRMEELDALAGLIADLAESTAEVVTASYTHLQQAQPVSLGHHLAAYAWMALRDRERFAGCARRLAVSPLGAGAGAGSSLPLRPDLVAASLGFDHAFENSMDAVAQRDVVAEYGFACAQAMTHLSRLAADVILWSTREFGWITLPDALATGSSALPHKKNPDIAELARGRAAAVAGDVVALLELQRGLPLTYHRDLQEDKRAAFHADDALAGTTEAMGALLAGIVFHPPPPGPWVGALDLAEALVERGVPFREAHAAVGRIVAELVASGRTLTDVTVDELAAGHRAFLAEDVALLQPEASVRSRRSPGGGSPASVAAQVTEIRRRLAER